MWGAASAGRWVLRAGSAGMLGTGALGDGCWVLDAGRWGAGIWMLGARCRALGAGVLGAGCFGAGELGVGCWKLGPGVLGPGMRGSGVLGAGHWVAVAVGSRRESRAGAGDISHQLRLEERNRAKQTAQGDSGVTGWAFGCPGDSTRGCEGTQGLPRAPNSSVPAGRAGCPQGRAACPGHATGSPAAALPTAPVCLRRCREGHVWELGLALGPGLGLRGLLADLGRQRWAPFAPPLPQPLKALLKLRPVPTSSSLPHSAQQPPCFIRGSAILGLLRDNPPSDCKSRPKTALEGEPPRHVYQFKSSPRHFSPLQSLPGGWGQTQRGLPSRGRPVLQDEGCTNNIRCPQNIPERCGKGRSTQAFGCHEGWEDPWVADRAMAAPRPSWSCSAGHPRVRRKLKHGWKTPEYMGKKSIRSYKTQKPPAPAARGSACPCAGLAAKSSGSSVQP